MGSGASSTSRDSNLQIISPRLEIPQKGDKEIVLDSVPLSDVGHGTIHYRYQLPEQSVHDNESYSTEEVPTGYFFHPKLKDYSDLTVAADKDARKFIKVVQAPPSDQNKNVFFISGIGLDGNVTNVPKSLISDHDTKRQFGHEYFTVSESVCDVSDATNILPRNVGDIIEISNVKIVIAVNKTLPVKEIKRFLSLHMIIPKSVIHILSSSSEELEDDVTMVDIVSVGFFSSEIAFVTLSVT